MPGDVITIGKHFGCTVGLAAFVGIPGNLSEHAHWTHQIAIDLDGGEIACYCDGEWFKSEGVFVPQGHSHSVQPGRQINLFFDKSVNWIDEIFGGKLDTSCARVLDRDTLQGIQSCFFHTADLRTGVALFADAFELRSQIKHNPADFKKWDSVLNRARSMKESISESDPNTYQKLGALFAL